MRVKKRIIFITDGDLYALRVVEHVAKIIGGRCISQSWGNPTKKTGEELVEMIRNTPHDPVLVMFDDCGFKGEGPGEQAMRIIHKQEDFEVIGAVAVASKTHFAEWTKVHCSIDRYGELTEYGIDKSGLPDLETGRINGDTVYILDELNLPLVIGIGDIGKMAGYDSVEKGAPITLKAINLILERSESLGRHKEQSTDK
ncbi:stage V sporulation protein AE [Fictibacillus phosphorivorans]|uniref:stage V sporulation protein AE n=1 Tax=Fictibacillus phosphorivorans TaxID=1221500 RepID=UPI00203D262E|nr:stage V sporulation protein AE [Fictibacillus phosphorivorans]MCM3719696.1 stage V sporulation protein AE [Fictibacillus phosphorivorans]MCM3777387.1 stage V sporulation protein AE [Fictibacillus phosphorivorans]